MGYDHVGFTSSIFRWMSCSWSSHSCISESKLSIRSDLSVPHPRPPCSSPRSRSMAAMTQAALFPGAPLNVNFLFLLFHKSVSVGLPAGGVEGGGRIDWPGSCKKKHHTHHFFIPLNLSFLEAYLLHSCDLCRRISAHRKVRNLQPSPLTFSPKIYSHVSRPVRVDLCVA